MPRHWKIPQPPIDLANRRTEGHSFWIGLVIALAAAAAIAVGTQLNHNVVLGGQQAQMSQMDLVRTVAGAGAVLGCPT